MHLTYFCFGGFTLLLTAHLLADFMFQPEWLIKKKETEYGIFLHALIHAVFTWLLLWQWRVGGMIIVLFIVHFLIDQFKMKLINKNSDSITIFLGDQVVHILSLWAILELNSFLVASSWWGADIRFWLFERLRPCSDIKLTIMVLISLLVLATCFAGHIIGFITKDIINKNQLEIDGLKNGGKFIGNLERALIFFLVLFNMPGVIGLIATAKSILRFGEIRNNWKTAEYILIGTLVSFLIAIVLGYIARSIIVRIYPAIIN